jgi:hypothetical protein
MIVPGLGDLPCFPCALDKRPLIKAWRENARRIEPPDHWPLVAVPTGIAFDVIDVDAEGLPWLQANRHLLQTRAHRTRHGWHFLTLPGDLSGSADDRIALGVHVRARGNYIVWWPRQGLEVRAVPLAPWPVELLAKARSKRSVARDKRNLPSVSVGPPSEASEALTALDPQAYRDHDNWLRVMMAAHAAGIEPDAFIRWSTSDPQYADDAEVIERRWESLTVLGNANGWITGWALFVEARMAELERYLRGGQGFTWEVPSIASFQPTQNLQLRMNALLRMLERAKDREAMLFRVACVVREIIAEGKLRPRVAIELLRSACKVNRLWWEDRGLCCRTIAAGFLTVERKTGSVELKRCG